MRISIEELRIATSGSTDADGDIYFDGVSIDSRDVKPGELFVALMAERDGHDYVEGAFVSGAAAALVSNDGSFTGPTVRCADTAAGLTAMAASARKRVDIPVIGITGSVGKTSTKDMARSILEVSQVVAASEKSHNNEIGVPLTILNAPGEAKCWIIEMGARGRGHIRYLCETASPTVGVVTTVAAAHTEMFGTLADIVDAKAELIESLPANGTAILNADMDAVAAMAERTSAPVLTFGNAGDLRAQNVGIGDDLRPRFELVTPWGNADIELAARGRHNVSNALAAAAASMSVGSTLSDVARGLAESSISPWRMELATSTGGGLVLNDSYNANPTSMAAALRSLSELPVGRKLAFLGYMAELGVDEESGHREIAKLADELGIEIVAVGTDLYGTLPMQDVSAVLSSYGAPREGTAVLIKGSRVSALEKIADAWT